MTTSDPHDAGYLDEKSVRDELTRTFDACGSCRRCVEHCSMFPALFDRLDQLGDAGRMTIAEQDGLVDACFHCEVCAVDCPYTPERDALAIDVPRLMLRADAMRVTSGQVPAHRRRTTRILGRTNLLATMPFARPVATSPEGSTLRRIVQRLTGISASRGLPSLADRRFGAWFAGRGERSVASTRHVTVVPTCLVEHRAPQVGADLVRVLEHNGIECSVSSMGCCGAPWLFGGEVARFTTTAERNVQTLATEVRAGGDLVVPEPTCGHVIQRDYVDHVRPTGRSDAELVAEHTYDAAEYLLGLHRAADGRLDVDFRGSVPRSITHQVGGRLRARGLARTAADLLRLTGAHVETVETDAADEVMWGRRVDHVGVAEPVARRLGAAIERAGADVVSGSSVLTNATIEEQTGRRPLHPVELLARAYGLTPEASDETT